MRHQTRTLPFEVKSTADAGDEGYRFSGLVAAYRSLDHAGDIFDDGAFSRDLDYTRAEGKVRDEHEVTTGRIVAASDTARGLEIEGLILPTTAGKDQYILAKGRAITRLSVGYVALEFTYLEGPEAVQAYWESKGYAPSADELLQLGRCYGVRLITRARCYEASTTWLPCNDNAVIDSVKSQGPHAGLTFADHLDAALAAVAEVVTRAEGLKTLRAGDGRALGTKSLAQIRGLHGRLAKLAEATEPPAETPIADDGAILDRFHTLEARLILAGF